jgi:hypothetical protein
MQVFKIGGAEIWGSEGANQHQLFKVFTPLKKHCGQTLSRTVKHTASKALGCGLLTFWWLPSSTVLRNATANILAEYWKHFWLSKTCVPIGSVLCLSTVCVYSYQPQSFWSSVKDTNLLFSLHNMYKKSRQSKQKNYVTSLRFSTLWNLQNRNDKGLWRYNLQPMMSSCISDLVSKLLCVW